MNVVLGSVADQASKIEIVSAINIHLSDFPIAWLCSLCSGLWHLWSKPERGSLLAFLARFLYLFLFDIVCVRGFMLVLFDRPPVLPDATPKS